MPRTFQVEFKLKRNLTDKEIINFFVNQFNYKFLRKSENALVFENGNKLLTYLGLTNWKILYRTIYVKQIDNKLVITYNFSWLSNVMSLGWSASGEIQEIRNKLNHLN